MQIFEEEFQEILKNGHFAKLSLRLSLDRYLIIVYFFVIIAIVGLTKKQ